jgi:hypothetical protein
MSGTQDPVTVALTGQLPFVLLVAAALALPVSFFLLWIYRRAVVRSMRARSAAATSAGSGQPSAPAGQTVPPPSSRLELSFADVSTAPTASSTGEKLFLQAERAPWRAAEIYAFAGACYAVVMTVGWLLATRDTFLPVKFLWLFWTYLWPLLLTVNLVAGSTRRRKASLVLVYFAVLGVLAAVALARSPELTLGQLFLSHWLTTNGPATILLLAFLARRIRAVGPLVISFAVVAVMGSQIGLDLVGRDQRLLRWVVNLGSHLGLSCQAIFYALIFAGFAAFAVVGWIVLQWIRRRYERKRISDQSLTFDSIWLLFGIVQSIEMVFDGWWWIFTGLAAFAAYKVAARVGFRVASLHPSGTGSPPKLLLLRVFSLGKRSERLFDALGKHWLREGSVRLIAGPDLATSTVEPHEFLDFLSGKLARRFIDSPQTLDLRLSEMDTRPDWDGRFRVTDFFCRDDTWKMVPARLINESDAVLMDLRGFSPQNAGCRYEIEELLNVASIPRLVFVIDDTTDKALLEQVARGGWSRLRADSPNRQRESNAVRLFRFTGSRSGELRQLLRWLCVAAASEVVG